MPPLSLYTVLGVPVDARQADIDQALARALAQAPRTPLGRWRAWLCGRSPEALRRAHAVLIDPLQRAEHDRWLDLQLSLAFFTPGH